MKIIVRILIVLLMILGFACSMNRPLGYGYEQASRDGGQYYATYQVFYDNLNPYGRWIENPQYGYIWIPDAGRDFFPYLSDGRWIYTDFGWTWLSDYEWGWAPFHYGRWDYDDYYGWFWVPGNEWGPAWVVWRRANGYYGWAPMQPGMNVRSAMIGGSRDVERWSFVSQRDFGRSDIQRHYINRRNNEQIFRNSTIINNTYIDNSRSVTYISGPHPEDVRRMTGRKVNTVAINDMQRPGRRTSGSTLQIYRPVVQVDDRRSVPPQVTAPGDIRPGSDRRSVSNRRAGDRSMGTRESEEQGSRRQKIENERQNQSGQTKQSKVQREQEQTKVENKDDRQKTEPDSRRTEDRQDENSNRRRR